MASIESLLDDLQWPPPAEGVASSRSGGGDRPVVALLDHPTSPYFEMVPDTQESTLRAIAHRYLVAASQLDFNPRFVIESSWVQALDPAQGNNEIHFAWMPIDERGGHEIQLPLRSMDASIGGDDHLVVLFAAERIGETFLGSEFGLRMVIQWRQIGAAKFLVLISGVSATLPFGQFRENPLRISSSEVQATIDYLFSAASMNRIAELADLRPDSIRICGVRVARMVDGTAVVERQCVGLRTGIDGADLPYVASTISTGAFLGASVDTDSLLHRSILVADAVGDARVFCKTPGPVRKCRPRRDDVMLDVDRTTETIKAADGNPPLAYPPNTEVIPCPRFVRGDIGAVAPVRAPLPGSGPAVRSNAASAVQPHWHARDLLQRMQAYGFNLSAYFQIINPQIEIAYRSGVSPGPGKDGQSVNARVQPVGWPPKFIGPVKPGEMPVVQIHLSLADRARRDRKAWTAGGRPTPAVPMGIGSDPRWMWHEFGHVLTLASTGELELRFAHSPGDALAAIVGDPELSLTPEQAMWRGATFPWVFLARRHDRCVARGWSWRGMMHRDLAESKASLYPRCKGYNSEQILSTTLFRLYRCLGGDTNLAASTSQPDHFERLRASHHACFLIMQGLRILGHAKTVPSLLPDQFEKALIDADKYLGVRKVVYPPATAANPFVRVGGCSTKLIRWCFEAQGLHADGPGYDFNCPGKPRPVDIYVKSLRPSWDTGMNGEVPYGDGSYVPVSLHWQNAVGAAAPLWQADPAAGIVWRPAAGQIDVNVGNRGTSTASGVKVSVWTIAWPGNQSPPMWQNGGGGWQQLSPNSFAGPNIPPGQSRTFGPFNFAPPAGRNIIVAIASCRGDKPLLELPNHACSFIDTPLADLVAGDNNLGLLVI